LEKIKVSKSKLMKTLKEKKKAKTPWDRFVEEYFTKGKQEGIKEGKQEGIKEGKMEGKMEIAQRMLAKNLSIDEISELTGLSEAQILALQPNS
jgi:predicted transposase/invertase (TIGR01784 family)